MPSATTGVSSTANGASTTDVSSNSPNAAAHSSKLQAVHAYTTVSNDTSTSATRPISNASTASSSVRGRSSRPVVTTIPAVLGLRPTARQFGASSINRARRRKDTGGDREPLDEAIRSLVGALRHARRRRRWGAGVGADEFEGALLGSEQRPVKTPALEATPMPALTTADHASKLTPRPKDPPSSANPPKTTTAIGNTSTATVTASNETPAAATSGMRHRARPISSSCTPEMVAPGYGRTRARRAVRPGRRR
jgi:hypothetical protein